jgi:predicted TIM-barrel fold metal-dependent hydrolase
MACVLTPMIGFDVIRKAAADHPDIVIPYGQINVDAPEALSEVEKFAAAGFKGIKMHSPRHNWDDPQYFPLYARMQELQLLALFHTGIAFHIDTPQYTSMARMRPSYLDTIARAFPNLYIQGAHLGNPWYDEAAEAARWCPKLYFDVTGSSLIKKEKNLAVFKDYLWWSGPSAHSSPQAVYAFEKLVFGTDEPPEQVDNMLHRYEALLDACGVPEPSRRKIFGETIARILRLNVTV